MQPCLFQKQTQAKNSHCHPLLRSACALLLLASLPNACDATATTTTPPDGAQHGTPGSTDHVSEDGACGAENANCGIYEACKEGQCVPDLNRDPDNCGQPGTVCPSHRCLKGACTPDLNTDPNNCGVTGEVCPSGMCEEGSCTPDLNTDPNNCGATGIVCATGACTAGECEPDLNSDPENCGIKGQECQASQRCTGGFCESDPQKDPNNCGSSSEVCFSGICTDGECEIDLDNDTENCGTKGNICASVELCVLGKCESDPKRDPDNCGNAGMFCATNQLCTNGKCVADLQNDPLNCGSSGRKCDRILEECRSGSCIKISNLSKDPNNCGSVGHVCSQPYFHCTSGKCRLKKEYMQCGKGYYKKEDLKNPCGLIANARECDSKSGYFQDFTQTSGRSCIHYTAYEPFVFEYRTKKTSDKLEMHINRIFPNADPTKAGSQLDVDSAQQIYHFTLDCGANGSNTSFVGGQTDTYFGEVKLKDGFSPDSLKVGCTWTTTGSHKVSLTGRFGSVQILCYGERTEAQQGQLTKITNWGGNPWHTFMWFAQDCVDLASLPADPPILTFTKSMTNMFGINDNSGNSAKDLPNYNADWGSLANWNVSNVVNMSQMFQNRHHFNVDVSRWDVSNVLITTDMFSANRSFARDLGGWDVGNIMYMKGMFSGVKEVPVGIGKWDVSNVTSMYGMFAGATFRQGATYGLDRWNVSKVKDMEYMFAGAKGFNETLNSWDVSNVENMKNMFGNNTYFNGKIGSWRVGGVMQLDSMFEGASAFDGDLSHWRINKAATYDKMFNQCPIAKSNKPAALRSK